MSLLLLSTFDFHKMSTSNFYGKECTTILTFDDLNNRLMAMNQY
jgi:hypothetical protein